MVKLVVLGSSFLVLGYEVRNVEANWRWVRSRAAQANAANADYKWYGSKSHNIMVGRRKPDLFAFTPCRPFTTSV